jgi:hypothetical protein
MDEFYFYLSGVALFLSIILGTVGILTYRRSRIKLLLFLDIAFLIIFVDSLVAVLVGFDIVPVPYSMEDMFLASDIVILIIFYLGVIRGN